MDSGKTKVIVALALMPLGVWIVGYAPPDIFMLIALAIGAAIGSFELSRLMFRENQRVPIVLAVASSIFVYVLAQTGIPELAVVGICAAFVIAFSASMFAVKEIERVWSTASAIVFAAIYTGLLTAMLVAIRRIEPQFGDSKLLIMHFAIVWMNDAGAFFVGKKFGKHKLWPRVSAGKTWEGLFGGAVVGTIAAVFVTATSHVWEPVDGLILGGMYAFLVPVGDLVESTMKRGAGVKDSGVFMPGHGGVLDRIDAILFAAPAMYFFAQIVGPGRMG
ncbi:phosphatidate cytidylyltransferase [bacterium]|nr:phosphatidate cytidylyltransferase [bacterium]